MNSIQTGAFQDRSIQLASKVIFVGNFEEYLTFLNKSMFKYETVSQHVPLADKLSELKFKKKKKIALPPTVREAKKLI